MQDPLADIHQYSTTLTITQVVKFCDKKELGLTRAMIQNYIRHGLLPPPVDKRRYTHKHLAVLALIGCLKPVFDMDTIKAAIGPLIKGEGLEPEAYRSVIKKWAEITAHWEAYMPGVVKGGAPRDISRLGLMLHAADVKLLAESLV
jgi:DNA-binding transcriptional MerR regulator